MPITQRNKIGMLEAMLFANAEPVETDRLAEAMRADPAEVLTLLEKLQKRYDETESGLMLLHFDGDRWQMATRPYYGEVVKRILDTRRNAPLSPAALEVLAIIAYNQPVSRSFIEQVRGVDSSSTVSKLMERGLIEEAGRLDLPGKPVAFRVTDTFLRVFGLGSLADLPPLHDDPQKEEELRHFILYELHSGATIYEAIGAYTMEKHNEIITIVDKTEYQKLMKYINQVDPMAFITIYNVSNMRYQPKI